jgi:hypothetical protein
MRHIISQVPVELLEEIFKYTPPSLITDSEDHWEDYAPNLICKYWKNVVDSATSLWSTISTDVPQWGRSDTTKLLELWIRKSGSARRLHIEIAFPYYMVWPQDHDFLATSRANLEAVVAQAHRWESLRIPCLTHQEAETIFRALVFADRLKHLDLLIPYMKGLIAPFSPLEFEEHYDYSASLPNGLSLECIQSYTTRGHHRGSPYHHAVASAICGPSLTSLTIARIQQPSASNFAAICQDCPNIASLTFSNISFESFPNHDMPYDVESWGEKSSHLIALPKLQNLRFNGPLHWEIPHVILCCGPHLTKFSMDVNPVCGLWDLTAALEHCPVTVSTVSIYCTRVETTGYALAVERIAARFRTAIYRLRSLSLFRVDVAASVIDIGTPETKRDMGSLMLIAQSRNFVDSRSEEHGSFPFLEVTSHKLCE